MDNFKAFKQLNRLKINGYLAAHMTPISSTCSITINSRLVAYPVPMISEMLNFGGNLFAHHNNTCIMMWLQ